MSKGERHTEAWFSADATAGRRPARQSNSRWTSIRTNRRRLSQSRDTAVTAESPTHSPPCRPRQKHAVRIGTVHRGDNSRMHCAAQPAPENPLDSSRKPALPRPVWAARRCGCSQPFGARQLPGLMRNGTICNKLECHSYMFLKGFIGWLKFSHKDSGATAMRLAHRHPTVIHRLIHRLCG